MEEMTEKTKKPEEVVVEVPLQAEVPKDEEAPKEKEPLKDKETPKEKEALKVKEATKELEETPKKAWKIPFLLCSVWFLATICNTFLVKTYEIATSSGLSCTIVAVQLASISLYSCMFNVIWDVPKNKQEVSWKTYLKLILPIVISILIRIGYNDRTIWPTPISDPYSLGAEAFFLLWMLFLSIVLLPEEDNSDHRSTILVAILGVGLIVGNVSANMYRVIPLTKLIAYAVTAAFELAYSKKIMRETGIHPTKLLAIISGLVFLGYSPIWIMQLNWLSNSWSYPSSPLTFEWVVGVFVFGVLSWVQTLSAFSLLAESTVQHYLVGSACNRIIRILAFVLITTFFRVGLWPEDFEGRD